MLPVDYQGNKNAFLKKKKKKNAFLPRVKRRFKSDYEHFAGDFVEMKTCTDVK